MNKHVNSIAGRLSLRPPQRRSLEILDRITEIAPPHKQIDREAVLAAIHDEFTTVSDFEREFPSVCFALATGVGKTRLMGAFISYLHLAHGINNFFVLAPNLTIYNKLIADFTPNMPKYVFTGIAEFATDAPEIITGDDYESRAGTLFDELVRCKINIFNISKINSEVRGGKAPRIKRLSEYIGQSYFDWLANLKDLVIIMDESHRYRASAGIRAINELKPVLGLELTATPFVETAKGPAAFKNVIYDYPLGRAMDDGFVKEPAVVTRKDFVPTGMSIDAIEGLKLEDGVHMHEKIKVELATYASATGNHVVKPFLLVIARDTVHASRLMERIKSDKFFGGAYREKVIQVDSSRTGAEEDEMITRLLAVESTEEPTEIVIHVNMLKEGWDVTNLYTIVPLRAANARILIEQSIGRGLRLPYGRRTGVSAVDTLNIIAHDKFQEIIDEAKRPDSPIRLQQIILTEEQLSQKTRTVLSQPNLLTKLGIVPPDGSSYPTQPGIADEPPAFKTDEERAIAKFANQVINRLSGNPDILPSVSFLANKGIQETIVREVTTLAAPMQMQLEGISARPDIKAVVAKTADLVIQQTIDIPRILIVPKGEVQSGFRPFDLDLSSMHYNAPSNELWVQHLHTLKFEIIGLGKSGVQETRPEDYIVSGLVDFDDVSYDNQADLLYDLAGQTVRHFRGYLSEEDCIKVLRMHQKEIARFIYTQMQQHYWENATDYEVRISRGFTELKDSAYSADDGPPMNYRQPPEDKSAISRYVYNGFSRCLYPYVKFQSDTERKMATIIERESLKWFRPAKGQFQIFYRMGIDHWEYQPDFVAETETCIYMIETKARNDLGTPEIIEKKNVGVKWCKNASNHAKTYNGKPWKYLLIPHDVVADNMTLDVLSKHFAG